MIEDTFSLVNVISVSGISEVLNNFFTLVFTDKGFTNTPEITEYNGGGWKRKLPIVSEDLQAGKTWV